MDWKDFPTWLKIESIIFIILIIFFLFIGLASIDQDIGIALLAEVFLPAIGALIALWILSYSIYQKSWKFFLYGEGFLVIIWILLWLITDNFYSIIK